jgi:hypothetical protein
VAEGVGFEPTETHKTSTVFETVPFVHSGILPGGRLADQTRVLVRQCFLKTLAQRADGTSVADAKLFPDEAGFTPRPAWQVIEAARRQYLTGELTLPTTPATRIFMRDGLVYFAERSTDGALPIRLMMEGVITREQMQRATVIVNGVEHVGRMFDADPTIDRASVELCAELFTDDVMIAAANVVVDSYELSLYRRHPSGIDRWYPHTVPVAGRQSEPSAPSAPPAAATRQAEAVAPPKPAAKPKQKAEATGEVRAAKAEAKPEAKPEGKPEPKNKLNAPPITQAVPVTAPMAKTTVPPPPITQAVPAIPPITTQVPVTQMPPPTAQIPVTPPPASNEVDASVIADEVAEAIKRAFAGMGAGQ